MGNGIFQFNRTRNVTLGVMYPGQIRQNNKEYVDLFIDIDQTESQRESNYIENVVPLKVDKLLNFCKTIPKILNHIHSGAYHDVCDCGDKDCKRKITLQYIDKKTFYIYILNSEKELRFMMNLSELDIFMIDLQKLLDK